LCDQSVNGKPVDLQIASDLLNRNQFFHCDSPRINASADLKPLS
jgi:hypothetical protein